MKLVCIFLSDYLHEAQELYKSLDTTQSGKVDKVICETIHLQLYRAVNKDGDNAMRYKIKTFV